MAEIAQWLESIGLGQYAELFAENAIDIEVLPELAEADLEKLGLPLGHRKKLLKAIRDLDGTPSRATESLGAPIEHKPDQAMEAERRQLTVMFVDLVGSTALSQKLDPEDFREVIRSFQETCTGIVREHGGYVAKHLGDGLLAYFGYPKAEEDDAERAVRAGLSLTQEVAHLDAAEPLLVRVGLETGLVVIGDMVGGGMSQEGEISGDTPNLAARLQQIAAPGQAVVGPTLRSVLGGAFNFEDLGPQPLKGIAEPVRAARVLDEVRRQSRFEARHAGGLTAFVGREAELDTLLRRWQEAKDGEGQVVLISGEPGIGKSRLTQELRERIADEPHTRLRYQCSPHHTNSALYPVIGQLTFAAGIEADESTATKLDKLEGLIRRGGGDLPAMAPLFADLLSIPTEDRYPALDYSPQRQREETLAALMDQFAGLSAAQPALAIYEDVHWVDPTTQELLDLMVERIGDLRALALITFRPEYEAPWAGMPNVTPIALARMNKRMTAQITAAVAGEFGLPDDVISDIAAKTEGVPLFIEELTKAVLEENPCAPDGSRVSELHVPATLKDSLTARLDRLGPAREVAQVGAVIGRTFGHDLLAAVSGNDPEALDEALHQLVDAQLLFQRGAPPDARYTFKHALIHDAAYESLLRTRRRQLHAQTAVSLCERFPEISETEPELLAHHYTEAGLAEKSIPYWCKAGQRAAQRSAYPESTAHLYKGLELLKCLPESLERDRSELDLQITLGPALMSLKGMGIEEVQQTYTRARELAEDTADTDSLFTALYGLWQTNVVGGSVADTEESAGDLMRTTEGSEDSGQRLQAHHANWTTSLFIGDPKASLHHTNLGSELYDREEHRTHRFLYGDHDPEVCGLGFGSMSSWFLGYPDRGVQKGEDCMALAGELAHPNSTAMGLLFVTMMNQFRRDAQATERYGEMGMALCAKHGVAAWGPAMATLRGWAQVELGGSDAVAEIGAGMQTWQAMGGKLLLPWFLALEAEAVGQAGKAQDALEKVAEGLAHAERTGEHWVDSELHLIRGDMLLARSTRNIEKAEAAFLEALEVARGQEAKSLELRAATSLARLWGENKKRAQAHELLAPIYGWFTEGFDTADLKEAKALLDELS